jgi:hypothetical protein
MSLNHTRQVILEAPSLQDSEKSSLHA